MSIKINTQWGYMRLLRFALLLTMALPWRIMPWYFNYKPNTVNPGQTNAVQQTPLVTLMLVPAGDARNQGRSLEHQFESSSAAAYACSLKAAIEKKYPATRVIISHKAGEIVQPFQIPTMVNTLDVDLVITINCYHELGPKPELYFYQFSYGADFVSKLTELSWYSVDSAYLFAKNTTHAWAVALVKALNADIYKALFIVHGPYKIPFKPLVGIKVPAIGIEMSMRQDGDWAVFVDPVAMSLEPIINPLVKQRTIQEAA